MNVVQDAMMKPLSSLEIARIVGSPLTIIEYGELAKYSDLSQVLTPEMPLVLLYETAPQYGHWVCLIDHGTHIEFMDSYGIPPDGELDWVTQHMREELGEEVPHLTKLLGNRPVKYNLVELQGEDTSTCGRYCCVRLLLKNMSLLDWALMLVSGSLEPDQLVTVLTLLR